MNVVFDINPIRYPLTGIGNYCFQLASYFQASSEIKNLVLLKSGGEQKGLLQGTTVPQTVSGWQPLYNVAAKVPFIKDLRSFSQQKAMGRRLTAWPGYIYHATNYQLAAHNGPSVVTFYDLSVFKYPQTHPVSRVRIMRKAIYQAARRADRIITISEFIKREIIDFLGCDESKIVVTYLAAEQNFKPYGATQVLPALKKFTLAFKRYTLFVGTIEPRKNIELLLHAYKKLPLALARAFPLVVVGHTGWQSDKLHHEMNKAQENGWLRYIGFCAESDLRLLLAGARLFLFPSLYEGFGLPPLEAMASGVPVIASDRAAMPEVVGRAGEVLPVEDEGLWAKTIEQCLQDESWQTSRINAGLEQAAKFSWSECAQQTLQVYRDLS